VRMNPTMRERWLRSSLQSNFSYYSHTHSRKRRKAESKTLSLYLCGSGGEWRGAIVAPLISCRNPYLKRLPAPIVELFSAPCASYLFVCALDICGAMCRAHFYLFELLLLGFLDCEASRPPYIFAQILPNRGGTCEHIIAAATLFSLVTQRVSKKVATNQGRNLFDFVPSPS
jgi:hypothetical protein